MNIFFDIFGPILIMALAIGGMILITWPLTPVLTLALCFFVFKKTQSIRANAFWLSASCIPFVTLLYWWHILKTGQTINWLMSKADIQANLGPPMFFGYWVIFATLYISLSAVVYWYYRKRIEAPARDATRTELKRLLLPFKDRSYAELELLVGSEVAREVVNEPGCGEYHCTVKVVWADFPDGHITVYALAGEFSKTVTEAFTMSSGSIITEEESY